MAVTVPQVNVRDAGFTQVPARLAHERGEPLDRVDLARDPPEQRGLVAAARTDLQHPGERATVARELGHARHRVRARDGLPETEGQRHVLVGAGGERFVHEDVPGQRSHCSQHGLVAYSLLAQALDHAQPRALRSHPDTGIPRHGSPATDYCPTSQAVSASSWEYRVRSICSGVSDTRLLAMA